MVIINTSAADVSSQAASPLFRVGVGVCANAGVARKAAASRPSKGPLSVRGLDFADTVFPDFCWL
jgi:hypothetical protein